ncbi:MAG: cupin domain-containing protein [Betaproteobacteria bacterium]
MARVLDLASAKKLGLPGRTSYEILSGAHNAAGVTFRLVEIPVPRPGEAPRGMHRHADFEECIYVLSGHGTSVAGAQAQPVKPGDTIHIPAGEPHVTRNTGNEPLILLCFFPVGDVARGTSDAPA